jgi:RHH-type transcriptional regulator, rel operon repressor / antitoxin RelB
LYTSEHMTTTLSVRLDAKVKKRLEALAKASKRSRSFLAAEAIAAYVEAEEWQLGEIRAGLQDLEANQTVAHDRVAKWLRGWGAAREGRAPK